MENSPLGLTHVIITASLFLHAVAHTIALVALIGQAASPGNGKKMTVRAWLFPDIPPRSSALLLLPAWALSAVAFFGAAFASWGRILPGELWGPMAFVGAAISTVGVVFVAGLWPGSNSRSQAYLNTFVAMFMNLAILTARYWLQWLPTSWIVG